MLTNLACYHQVREGTVPRGTFLVPGGLAFLRQARTLGSGAQKTPCGQLAEDPSARWGWGPGSGHPSQVRPRRCPTFLVWHLWHCV